jgi:hypothetical protein
MVYKDEELSNICEQRLADDKQVDTCCTKYDKHMVDEVKLKASLKHHFERLLSSRKPVVDQAHLCMSDEEWKECNAQKNWPVKVRK